MKTKTKSAKITEHTWELLHVAFVTPRKEGDFNDPPTLRELAAMFGVPLKEAERLACLDEWEAEREANTARTWLERHGRGATTEAEFIEQWGDDVYSHIRSRGPEGERLVKAMARKVWIREQAHVAVWAAIVEQWAAEEAYEASEKRQGRAA
jgi:hypothetical protein